MQCFWGLKPYSHLPITLFITRGLVHTCIQGAHTPSVPSITHAWVLAHSAACAASHRCMCTLRTCRHTDTCTRMWVWGWHEHTRAHGDVHARTQPLHSQHRTPAPAHSAHSAHTYTNSISFPLHARTHAHPLHPLLLPVTVLLVPKPPARGCPLPPVLVPPTPASHSLLAAAPSRVAPAALSSPWGAPQAGASFVPGSPWHNQVPHAGPAAGPR